MCGRAAKDQQSLLMHGYWRSRPESLQVECTYLVRSTCLYSPRLFPKYFLSELRAANWAAQVPCFSHSCFLQVHSDNIQMCFPHTQQSHSGYTTALPNRTDTTPHLQCRQHSVLNSELFQKTTPIFSCFPLFISSSSSLQLQFVQLTANQRKKCHCSDTQQTTL